MMLSIYLHDFELGPGLHRSHFTIQPGFLHSTELLWEILPGTGPGSCWAPPASPQLDQCHHSLNEAFLTFCHDLAGVTPTANFVCSQVTGSAQIQVTCSFCFILHCTSWSPDEGLIWHEYHDINNKTWIWHEYQNQVMAVFTLLTCQLPAEPPMVCDKMSVPPLWGSALLHPLEAGTALSFLTLPHVFPSAPQTTSACSLASKNQTNV